MTVLINSDEIWEIVHETFETQRQRLFGLVPGADIQHTGSTAVPHSLTKGDLDIQVRVVQDKFELSKDALSTTYQRYRTEIWSPTLALFHEEHPTTPIGIALTVKGSGADEFYKLRDLFLADPGLVQRYNELKVANIGKSEEEYRNAKAEFFGPIGSSYLLDNT